MTSGTYVCISFYYCIANYPQTWLGSSGSGSLMRFAVKLSAGATVIWRLSWGNLFPSSLTWLMVGGLTASPPRPLHRLSVLTHGSWPPLTGDPREEASPRQKPQAFVALTAFFSITHNDAGAAWEGTVCTPGGGDCRGPSWRLPLTTSQG